MINDDALIEGEIVIAKLVTIKPKKDDPNLLEERFRVGSFLLFIFLVFAMILWTISAMARGEVQFIKWTLVGIAPPTLVFLIPAIIQRATKIRTKRHPDERVLAAVDWLDAKTKAGEFGYVPSHRGTLTWLTDQGLYSKPNKLVPWEKFAEYFIRRSYDVIEVVLIIKDSGYRTAQILLSCLCLTTFSGAVATLIIAMRGFRSVGPRDDLFMLLATTGLDLLFFAIFVYAFTQMRRLSERKRIVAFIDKQYQSDENAIAVIARNVPRIG